MTPQSAASRPVPALVRKIHLLTEYHRKLKGYPRWKQVIFAATRAWLRFCDVRLGLPTIIHHDKKGYFTIDYLGCFDEDGLLDATVETLRTVRNGSSRLVVQDLRLNAVDPEASGRYHNAHFYDSAREFRRVDETVRCPYNGSVCNPDETVKAHDIIRVARESQRTVESARKLKRSLQ